MDDAFFDIPARHTTGSRPDEPLHRTLRDQALKAQAIRRRESLLDLLERLAENERLNRRDSLDLVMAVIEDAHSAEPVLFGADAAEHLARLNDTRRGLDRRRADVI